MNPPLDDGFALTSLQRSSDEGSCGSQTRATGLAVLAGSAIAVIIAAFSRRFRSLTRIR